MKASDNPFPSILVEEATEPSAPAAGHQRLYIDSSSHKLKRTDSSGTDVTLEETLPVSLIDAKGDLIVGTAADTAGRLAVGTDDFVLTADAAETSGMKWAAAAPGGDITTDAAWAAKGDLIVGTGNDTAAILTAGTDDYVLTADSGEATGLKWAAVSLSADTWDALMTTYAPVHRWKFDEASGDFADSGSAGSLTLTVAGSPTYQATDPFGAASAARMNGAVDGTTANLGSLPTGANARTLVALLKVTPDGTTRKIIGYGANSLYQDFYYSVRENDASSTDSDEMNINASAVATRLSVGDGLWHVLAIAIFSSRIQAVYLDGNMVTRGAANTVNTTAGVLTVNDGGSDITVADLAGFDSWIGKAKLDRLYAVLSGAID